MTIDHSGHLPPDQALHNDAEPASHACASGGRRPYTTPLLDVYGNIRALTLGGSLGVGESGTLNKSPLGLAKRQPRRPVLKPRRPSNPNRR